MFSHHTIKITMMFLIAVVLVNLANYIFYVYYKPSAEALSAARRPIASGIFLGNVMSSRRLKKQKMEQTPLFLTNKKTNFCPDIPSGLGPVALNTTMFLYPKEDSNTFVSEGFLKIKTCTPKVRAAIIVPIQTETVYVYEFVNYLHSFLRKQFTGYQVFVVKQNAETQYHRGRLLNAVFTEMDRLQRFHCIIIQELGLLPMDTRNMYRCSWYPRQLLATVTEHHKVTSYQSTFGGVVALTPEQMFRANGFSNTCEDRVVYADMAKRLAVANYVIERSPSIFGNYTVFKEVGSVQLESESTQNITQSNLDDGLSSTAYAVEEYQPRDTFTFMNIVLPDNKPLKSYMTRGTQIQSSAGKDTLSGRAEDKLENNIVNIIN